MIKHVKIDKAIYWVDDDSKTYGFYKRNPGWENLDPYESLQSKKRLEGYTRIFKNGKTRIFRYNQSPSRRAKERHLQRRLSSST